MKILVTGATGGLGGVTARALARLGHDVHGLGRNRTLGDDLMRDGITFHQGDITDRTFVGTLTQDIDVLIHCAALSSPWGVYQDFFAANVTGTDVVAEAAYHVGARLVHVSSTSVCFDFHDRRDIIETVPIPTKFANDYARTKYLAEQVVSRHVEEGLDAVIIRPRAIFGETDTALLPRLLRAAELGFLPLVDGGRALTDLTHVDNVAQALILAAIRPEPFNGDIINISGGEPISVEDLFKRIVDHLDLETRFIRVPYRFLYLVSYFMEKVSALLPGRPEPMLTRYSVGLLAKSQTLSIERAKRELGYNPVPFSVGLMKTLDAWKANHA